MKLPKFFQLKSHEEIMDTDDSLYAPRQLSEVDNLSREDYREEQSLEPCRHQWKERTQSYAPPRFDTVNTNYNADADLLSTLMMGVTTIIDECLLCHELRKTSMLGNPNPQLDQILNNVIQYGPQYMQRNNHTFVFQEYIPPRQQVQGGIPIR